MRKELDEAIDAWNSARDAYEQALSDGGEAISLREAVGGAEVALANASLSLTARLRTAKQDLEPLLGSLGTAVQARVAALEHRGLEAERSAGHGELAGAGHGERDEIARLESAGLALGEIAAAFGEALEALDA